MTSATEDLNFQFYLNLKNLNLDTHMHSLASLLDSTGLEHMKERAVRKDRFPEMDSRISLAPSLLGFLPGSELVGWRGGML